LTATYPFKPNGTRGFKNWVYWVDPQRISIVKCHLVYSVPIFSNRALRARIIRKIRTLFNQIGIPVSLVLNRQPTTSDFETWPIQSPSENTRNLYCALSTKMPTLLYHLTERVNCNFETDDIFIGHPYFPHTKGKFGVTEMALKSKIRPRITALITPLHCDVNVKTNHINRDFLDDVDKLLPFADLLFAIMGEYWWKEWEKSPYRHWKTKMVRLDMAVDAKKYPRVKESFNPPGKRGYLYIGNSDDPRKGVDFLNILMKECGDFPKGWIGSGPEIASIPRISNQTQLTPDFMAILAKQYDFFVSTARADPNPTTILESMAWGFPVLCTPQCGYFETDFIKNLYLDDINGSLKVLRDMQYTDERQLIWIADKARQIVVNQYNWDIFTSTIIKNLGI
jgi:glycosyltransferase involved in cell wall biosynthesis